MWRDLFEILSQHMAVLVSTESPLVIFKRWNPVSFHKDSLPLFGLGLSDMRVQS